MIVFAAFGQRFRSTGRAANRGLWQNPGLLAAFRPPRPAPFAAAQNASDMPTQSSVPTPERRHG
jgi:hypothetical protein